RQNSGLHVSSRIDRRSFRARILFEDGGKSLLTMAKTVRVLFVCVGNCVRSQMAEAIARHDASDIIVAESAGVHPLGFIDNTTQRVLRERGISSEGQFSKST